MDLESGSTVYVEATTERIVRLTIEHGKGRWSSAVLTTEEARTLANALLAAVVEAETEARTVRDF